MRIALAALLIATATPAFAACPMPPAGEGWDDSARHQAVLLCQQREIAAEQQQRAYEARQTQLQTQIQAFDLQRRLDWTANQPRF